MSHAQRLEMVSQQLAALEGRDVGDGLLVMQGSSNHLMGGVHLCLALFCASESKQHRESTACFFL